MNDPAGWASSFEQIRVGYQTKVQKVRNGKLERNWPVLQHLARSCPHFILDGSQEYTDKRMSEKLAAHFIHAICLPPEKLNFQETSPGMFTPENGDELMVRAALNWSPRERFLLDKIETEANEWELLRLLEKLAKCDQIAFDALGIALDIITHPTRLLGQSASILLTRFLRQEITRPKGKKGKRPVAKTVHRRLATRLFLYEMNSLGFELGSNREGPTGDKACDAAHDALRFWKHNPPSVGTILEDWNDWNYKGT